MSNTPMPVTILTGFLGAGKTTLLNDIIRKKPDTNFLIIENEAGEINIDGQLLDNKNQNKVFELSNGCICCSLNTELGTLLNSIILSGIKYDYVLIEATGMADPGQVIDMFTGPRVQKYFSLDGVIGLIDASTFLSRLGEFTEIRRQVAQSDVLLINKTDLATPENLQAIEQELQTINPLARIEKTQNSNTEGIKILNCELFQAKTLEKSVTDFSQITFVNPKEHAHQIQTFSFIIPGFFDMRKLSLWLDDFLYFNAKNILRVKGILSIEEMQHKIALQSVGDNFHISQGSLWQDHEERESRMVFIGTNLDAKELERSFYGLLANPVKLES